MQGKELMENPFKNGDVIAPNKNHALVEVESSRAVMEAQSAMVIAKRFPRDPIEAMDKILNACTRQSLAESALYTYARGGTNITGPSIRLAEAMAQCWQNLSFGIRELEQRDGSSTVEAFAWDVETNVKQVKIFQVPHKRFTKKGSYKIEDSRDVYELVANQGARRLRACILGVIPGDVVEAAVKQCETTLKTKAEVTPERIASLVEKFGEYGVTKSQIEQRIQRRLDAITPAQVVSLGKIYNSLKDAMSAPGDWFQIETVEQSEEKGVDALKSKLKTEKKPVDPNEAETVMKRYPNKPEPAMKRYKTLSQSDADAILEAMDKAGLIDVDTEEQAAKVLAIYDAK